MPNSKALPTIEIKQAFLNFSEGFAAGAAALLAFVQILQAAGLLEPLAKLLGLLAGLSPVLMTFGMALFFLAPALTLVSAAMGAVVGIAALINAPIAAVAAAILGLITLLAALEKRWHAVTGAVKWFGNIVSKIFGHSVGTMIARDLNPAISSLNKLNSLTASGFGAGPMAGRGTAGPQYLSIYPEISLEGATISSDVDLMAISDAVDTGIAEALRRRAYPRWGRR